LYLQVSDGGGKSWLFRFMLAGRARAMGLGSLNTISLAEARDEAMRCRKLLREKIDPIEARNTSRGTCRSRHVCGQGRKLPCRYRRFAEAHASAARRRTPAMGGRTQRRRLVSARRRNGNARIPLTCPRYLRITFVLEP